MAYVSPEKLDLYIQAAERRYVKKEHKTGSDTAYKVLSDNNLTDELVEKIQNAGDSTFNGDYAALTSKPSIGGKELAAGDQTAASLGLATPGDVTTGVTNAIAALDFADAEVANQYVTAVSETDGVIEVSRAALPVTQVSAAEGTANGTVSVSVNGKATDVAVHGLGTAAYAAADGFEAKGAADAALTSAKAYVDTKGYATTTQVDDGIAAAKTELGKEIETKISASRKLKGTVAFADLPAVAEAAEGDQYDVKDAFTTTADFSEGAGIKVKAGMNIYCVAEDDGTKKWNLSSLGVDTSDFITKDELTECTEAEILALINKLG